MKDSSYANYSAALTQAEAGCPTIKITYFHFLLSEPFRPILSTLLFR